MLGIFALFPPAEPAQAGDIGPGGAMALAAGDKQLRTGYAVDGDTLDTWIYGQQVAVGIVGLWAPQGNTACGN